MQKPMSFEETLAYNGELFRALQVLFVSNVPAEEFTDLPCISTKLTTSQIQSVRHRKRNEGSISAARLLLDYLYKKPDWFDSVLEALQSPHTKLADLKPQFLQIKAQVDTEWQAQRRPNPMSPTLHSNLYPSSDGIPGAHGGTYIVEKTEATVPCMNPQVVCGKHETFGGKPNTGRLL